MTNLTKWFINRSMKSIPLTVVALCAVTATVAMAEGRALPDKNFACQVQTESGVAGLVSIQTDSLAMAKKAVIGESALTLGGVKSPTRSVVECVVAREGKFRDSRFQDFYRKLLK